MKLNNKLSQARLKSGLSQTEVAEALQVSRQSVSRWECGSAFPSMDRLIALSRLYGVDIQTLASDYVPPSREEPAPQATPTDSAPAVPAAAAPPRRTHRLIWIAGLLVCALAFAGLLAALSASFPREPEHDVIPIEDLQENPSVPISDEHFSIGW